MHDLILPVTLPTLLSAAVMVALFVGALFVGALLLPGSKVMGFPAPPDGQRRQYKMTGLPLFLLTHAVVAFGVVVFGWRLTALLTHFWSLFIVANVLAFGVSGWLYFKGHREETTIEREGDLPDLVQDLWFGTQRDPTFLGVDLKMFAYQPSLIGLGLFQFAFAARQIEVYGILSPQMMLHLGFWWAYLYTHYFREDFMLSTWDIIAERFGFMLVWGDLVYVPFFYSLCGWFLIDQVSPWGVLPLMALALFHVAGHWIFREANWQKDRFKRDPEALIWGRPAELIGGRLLVSGWWGVGRKINYSGEIMVYLSFALCTGFSSWIPYALPASLIVLLTHRAYRDDKKCREKYGVLWDDYCARAKFKIFPGIF